MIYTIIYSLKGDCFYIVNNLINALSLIFLELNVSSELSGIVYILLNIIHPGGNVDQPIITVVRKAIMSLLTTSTIGAWNYIVFKR